MATRITSSRKIKKIIFLFFILIVSKHLLPKDKIVLKSGDVYFMTVEKISAGKIFISDNMNRLTIPISLIEYVDYDKNSLLDKKLSKAKDSLNNKNQKESDWQISHYDNRYIYWYNKNTSAIKKILNNDYSKIEKINKKFPMQWGVSSSFQFFMPKETVNYKLLSAWLYGVQLSHKKEFNYKFVSFYFDVESLYGVFSTSVYNQGIDIFHLLANVNFMFYGNVYFRSFVQFGLGMSYLSVYNNYLKQNEITPASSLRIGFEIFILPYFSVKFSGGYQTYWQELSIDSLSGYTLNSSMGYYF